MTQSRFEFDASVSSAVLAASTVRTREPRKAAARQIAKPPAAPSRETLSRMHRYWQAANFLTVGQIFLQENPLLREPLRPEHVKPRLLGHWGTSPGLSLVYVHANRLIRERDADMIFLAGPGHGGPAVVANVYLEGTYSEIYPEVTRDIAGLRRLMRQFSTPGGIPSHVSVPTPGSIHEGGELGYVLAHAFGAVFDNPDLVATAVVGDGEAETGPLAGSWKSTSFLDPRRDGAVLPVLHLNGYKISGPTVTGRWSDDRLRGWLDAEGYDARFVEGDDPLAVHASLAVTMDAAYDQIRAIQQRARATGDAAIGETRWPAIVLRTPKGWTGPKEIDGLPVEGTFRSHQVPLPRSKSDPGQLALLEQWLRSYDPESLFDERGALVPELTALAPEGDRRMGASPHANGGRLVRDLELPDYRQYAVEVSTPGVVRQESTRRLGALLRDVFERNAEAANFRIVCPDETNSNRLSNVFDVENRTFNGPTLPIDDHVAPDGRVMEVLSEQLCEGWLEGYLLTGRHGLYVTYESFAMISASMTVQHTKWLAEAERLAWRAPIASLNILLTSTCWRNDHNGFSHQGPGLIDVVLSKRGAVSRIYLPPDANTLLSVADHCLRSRDYVNLIVIDKQPELQWLSMDAAEAHASAGASRWQWASNTSNDERPDVVLACAGDTATLETVAAAWWLRRIAPEFNVRVVNVVDLMTLFPPDQHPHGMSAEAFEELFTSDRPVVFAFHGYQRALHAILHGRPRPERFHVRGFNEQGTTTTPFDMVVLNGMSRFHLAALALRRAWRDHPRTEERRARCSAMIDEAVRYAREHFEDPPEIAEWSWS